MSSLTFVPKNSKKKLSPDSIPIWNFSYVALSTAGGQLSKGGQFQGEVYYYPHPWTFGPTDLLFLLLTMHIVPYGDQIVPYESGPPTASSIVGFVTAARSIAPTVRDLYSEYRKVYGYQPATVAITPTKSPTPGPFRRGQAYNGRTTAIVPNTVYSSPNRMSRHVRTRKRPSKRVTRNYPSRSQTILKPNARVEIKSRDITGFYNGVVTNTYSGPSTNLLGVAGGGTTVVSRLGAAIKTLDIRYSGWFLKSASSTSAADVMRLVFFEWVSTTSSFSTLDIFAQDGLLGLYNQTGARKFKILKDIQMPLNSQAYTGTGATYDEVRVPFRGMIRVPFTVNFTDTFASSADRFVYCMAVAAVGTNTSIYMNTQLRFYDY